MVTNYAKSGGQYWRDIWAAHAISRARQPLRNGLRILRMTVYTWVYLVRRTATTCYTTLVRKVDIAIKRFDLA